MAEKKKGTPGHADALSARFLAALNKVGQAVGIAPKPGSNAQYVPGGDGIPSSTIQKNKGSIVGLPRTPILRYAKGNYSVMATLTSLYSQVAASRKEYLQNHEKVRGFYLVEALISAVADDALVPDATTGEVLQLTSTNDKIDKELQSLQETIQLDQMVNDIIVELLSFGEYNVRMEVEEGKGVVALHDDIDQSSVVAMYSRGYPELYLWINPMTRMLDVIPPWGMANFVLGKYRLRIDAQEEITQALQMAGTNMDMSIWDELPKYTRVGRPLLYGTLGKIAELQTLEALVPAMKLSRLAAGSIVGVTLPGSQNPEDAFKICRQYEEALNRKININRDNRQMSVAEITAAAGEIKVIPVWDNRGSLERNDVRGTQEAQDILQAINDDRNAVCSSIGFPTEILFNTGDEVGKVNVLKRYARYMRMLKMVQGASVHGAKQMGMAHLANRGVKFDPRDIDVRFNNTLIDVEQLEVLEYIDATMSMVDQVSTFLTDLEDTAPGTVNKQGRAEWTARVMGTIVNDIQLINADEEKPDGDKEKPDGDQVNNTPPADSPEARKAIRLATKKSIREVVRSVRRERPRALAAMRKGRSSGLDLDTIVQKIVSTERG